MKMKKTIFYKPKRLKDEPKKTESIWIRIISLFGAGVFLTTFMSINKDNNSSKKAKVLSTCVSVIDDTIVDTIDEVVEIDYKKPIISSATYALNVPPKKVPIISTTLERSVIDNETTTKSTRFRIDSDTLAINDKEIQQEIQKRDIMKDQGWTEEMFDISCAVVLAEAKALSYEDAYGVTSTLLNRTNSKTYNYCIDQLSGEGAGKNIYYQIIHPNQFEVYYKGLYVDFLPEVFPGSRGGYEDYESVTDLPGYQAFLDCLTTKKPSHNFLNFCGSHGKKENKVPLVPGGNLYFNELEPEDKMELVKNKTISLLPKPNTDALF